MPKLKCRQLSSNSNNGLPNIRKDLPMLHKIKMEGTIFIMKGFLVVLLDKSAEDLVVLFSINPTQVMLAINYHRVVAKVILQVQRLSHGTKYHFKIMVCHIKRIRVLIRTPLEMKALKQDLSTRP